MLVCATSCLGNIGRMMPFVNDCFCKSPVAEVMASGERVGKQVQAGDAAMVVCAGRFLGVVRSRNQKNVTLPQRLSARDQAAKHIMSRVERSACEHPGHS